MVRRDPGPAGPQHPADLRHGLRARPGGHRPQGARLPHLDQGQDARRPQPYSALNPETYYWAHATFVEHLVVAADTFIRPLGRAEKDQLIAESVTWFERYGVSARGIPTTWARSRPTGTTRSSTAWSGTAPRRTASATPPRAGPAPPACPDPCGGWSASGQRVQLVPHHRRPAAAGPRDPRPALGRRPRAPLPPVRPAWCAHSTRCVRRLPPRMRLHPIAARAFAREAGR